MSSGGTGDSLDICEEGRFLAGGPRDPGRCLVGDCFGFSSFFFILFYLGKDDSTFSIPSLIGKKLAVLLIKLPHLLKVASNFECSCLGFFSVSLYHQFFSKIRENNTIKRLKTAPKIYFPVAVWDPNTNFAHTIFLYEVTRF